MKKNTLTSVEREVLRDMKRLFPKMTYGEIIKFTFYDWQRKKRK